jgi:hypothetical protein
MENVIESYILSFIPLLSVTYIQSWLQSMLQCYESAYRYSFDS